MTRTGGSRTTGFAWEAHAARFLEAQGLRVLERSWNCRLGEIDLVCEDGPALVIVEVRARRRTRHGTAAETIGPAKRQRIVRATRHYLMHHPQRGTKPIRFDVVAIDGIDTPEPELNWIRNAFDAG